MFLVVHVCVCEEVIYLYIHTFDLLAENSEHSFVYQLSPKR